MVRHALAVVACTHDVCRKLALLLCEHNSGLYDIVKIVLISWNAGGVGAHVGLAAELNGKPVPERVSESVSPTVKGT